MIWGLIEVSTKERDRMAERYDKGRIKDSIT